MWPRIRALGVVLLGALLLAAAVGVDAAPAATRRLAPGRARAPSFVGDCSATINGVTYRCPNDVCPSVAGIGTDVTCSCQDGSECIVSKEGKRGKGVAVIQHLPAPGRAPPPSFVGDCSATINGVTYRCRNDVCPSVAIIGTDASCSCQDGSECIVSGEGGGSGEGVAVPVIRQHPAPGRAPPSFVDGCSATINGVTYSCRKDVCPSVAIIGTDASCSCQDGSECIVSGEDWGSIHVGASTA